MSLYKFFFPTQVSTSYAIMRLTLIVTLLAVLAAAFVSACEHGMCRNFFSLYISCMLRVETRARLDLALNVGANAPATR